MTLYEILKAWSLNRSGPDLIVQTFKSREVGAPNKLFEEAEKDDRFIKTEKIYYNNSRAKVLLIEIKGFRFTIFNSNCGTEFVHINNEQVYGKR